MNQEKPKLEKKILIFYHGKCPDGFSAAWVAHKKFGDQAEYIPATHNEMYHVKGKEIYMVDICISDKEEDVKELVENNDVTFIDHHASRQNLVPLFKKSHFALDRSGAMLTWEYFYPGQEPPLFLCHVQAQDLWAWTLPNTREIMTAVSVIEQTFENWDRVVADLEQSDKSNIYIDKGKIMLDYFNILCEQIADDQISKIEFEGRQIYAVNAPHIFASLIGHKLASMTDSFGVVWYQDDEYTHVSLRAAGDFDASTIAKKYSGGGHKAACGFKLPLGTPLPWKVIKETNN